MAKKITDTEAQVAEPQPEVVPTPEPEVKTEEVPAATEPEKPQTKEPKKTQVEKAETEIPEHANKILKAFPNYSQLYIDFSGGTFTVDTPLAFRSNATLYTNPYFKS